MRNLIKGQSIVEVIVAVAIFITLAASGVVSILGAFSSTRLSEEEGKATMIAAEGINAAYSIKNKNWDALVDGNYGLADTDGYWILQGQSDTTLNKYLRVVTISSVRRNLSGEIADEGSIDNDTKLITSKVSWNFSPLRDNLVEIASLVTNWQESVRTFEEEVQPSVTLTPTPQVNSCENYCQSVFYGGGNCRNKVPDCSANGEVYQPDGNLYCTTTGASRCCCTP